MPRTLCLLVLSLFAFSAQAAEKHKGQNAFTRAAEKPLEGVMTPVPNPKKVPCNGVVDCRKKGRDLETVWQFNNSDAHTPRDYPAPCYRLGEGGKYVYAPSTCRNVPRAR